MEVSYKGLSIAMQCRLLGISRSSYYHQAKEIQEDRDVADLQLILAVLRELPFYGYRKISHRLKFGHPHLTRKRVRRIMRRFGLRALYAQPRLTVPRKEHKKYPYLLAGKLIRYPNQVWASDITYCRLPGGHVYLAVILDLYSRKVLSWRLSNTLDAGFCVEALEEAIELYGVPAIFNTDQGCQYTSEAFVSVLKRNKIEISMSAKGRALDNVYVERLWRTLKYEDIYLKSYETMAELRAGITRYWEFYNTERFHQSHSYLTPNVMYKSFSKREEHRLAA